MPKSRVPKPAEGDTPMLEPNLDERVGRALRAWFQLYEAEQVDYLTAGSQDGTENLTIVMRLMNKKKKFCTFPTYEEVAECFVKEVNAFSQKSAPAWQPAEE